MSQKHYEDLCFNPSKLFLMQYLANSNPITSVHKIRDFQVFLYRIYADNPEIAKKHPSYIVRNLGKYGIKDLEELVNDTLDSWVRDAKNGVLIKGADSFAVQVDIADSDDVTKNTYRLCKMLYKKLYSGNLPEIQDSDKEIINLNDEDIATFGNSAYKKRVLEDYQYCPICEELDTEKLYCVHILSKKHGATENELCDKANGLLFCKKHAEQYIQEKFYFDELGFAHNIDESDVEIGMHLSFSIRTPARKKYLMKKHEKLVEMGKIKLND